MSTETGARPAQVCSGRVAMSTVSSKLAITAMVAVGARRQLPLDSPVTYSPGSPANNQA